VEAETISLERRSNAMKTIPVALVLLALSLSLPGCSDDDESPTSPEARETSITFRKVPNVALYGGANYEDMLLYVRSDGSVTTCQEICEADPECNFFYYNERGGLVLDALTTQMHDCAFFRGRLWVGSAPRSDTYVKQVDGVDAWDVEKARF
jgi:hypothetical protein